MNDELRWFPVGPPASLHFDPGAVVVVDGLEIAIFPLGDGYRALVNSCPHAGGPLAEGIRRGDSIECLWHGWSFDIRTGACHSVPKRPARCVAVRERDRVLEIGLPPAG